MSETSLRLYSYPPMAYSHSCSLGKDNLTVKEAAVLRDLVREL